MVEPTAGPVATRRNPGLQWLVFSAAALAGAFEAITIYATLSGQRPTGALLGCAVLLGLGVSVAMLTTSGPARRRLLAKAAIAATAVAIISVLLVPARIAEAQGSLPSGIPLGQSLLLLLFQLGWAATHWITVTRASADQTRFIPAALGAVLLIGGGFVLGQAPDTVADTRPEQEGAVYKVFPTAEELDFATPTETAGEGSGSEFAHYHAGGQPLLGLSFSTREWFRRDRISADLTAVFDRDSLPDGAHLLIAPEGFVVAGVEVQADDNVSALRVEFAPFDGTFVSPFDRYWTEWYGGYDRADRGLRLDGNSAPIVGVRGTSGLVLTSLGLLVRR